jgi:hypothetical protein
MIVHDHPLLAIGPERVLLAGSIACNGSTSPTVAASSRGRDFGHLFVATYAATGVYTLTWPTGFTLLAQPASIIITPQFDAIANGFEAHPIGETTLIATTRTLVIQAHRARTPFEPAAAAGTRINFMLFVSNNTGK